MDQSSFDYLTKNVAKAGFSRRGTFKLLAGTALAAVLARAGFEEAAARCARVGARCERSGDCCRGAICRKGKCACKAGTKPCNGVCRNLQTDENNCGACGRRCEDGETCSDGFCVLVSDVPGTEEVLDGPHGLAVGANGTLIVADSNQHKIEIFEPGVKGLVSIGGFGTEEGRFDSPTGVAFAGSVFFVVDKGNHRIQRFSSENLAPTLSFGSFGSGPDQLRNPSAAAVDLIRPDFGTVYVADTGNHRIKGFSLDGTFQSQFGSLGSSAGQLNLPTDVAVSSIDQRGPRIYVVDLNNNRVQIFDRSERFVGAFGRQGSGNGEFLGPRGVAIGPDGTVWVTDGGNDRVQQFTVDGTFLRVLGGPGSAPGRFNGPEGIAVARDGTVHVSETGNGGRVQSFKPARTN